MTVELAEKPEKFVQCEGGGMVEVGVEENLQKSPSLSDEEAADIARLLVRLEEEMGKPQDFEWAMEKGKEFIKGHYCTLPQVLSVL